MFNMNLLQGNSVGDVSLDAIAVMAQAQSEVTIGLICFTTYDLCGLEYEFGHCISESEGVIDRLS